MKPYPLSHYFDKNSPLVFGCMGLGGGWTADAVTAEDVKHTHRVIDTAIEAGITVFDHADIYTFGKAEIAFGKVLAERPALRDQILLQSKCGIRFEEGTSPKRYDFSANWIQQSVDNILSRLHIEQLDILMLHRPDPLMQPAEIAEVFSALQASGKVKHVGVSNMQAHQMAFLQASLNTPLVCNQIELSLSHLSWLEDGVTGGCAGQPTTNFGTGTLEYCRTNNIQMQSWGCLSQGLFSGQNVDNQAQHIQQTAQLVTQLAAQYAVSKEAIVLAWLMKHPANIQPVIGTTNLERIKACAQATKVQLSREQWYALYVSARGHELP